MQPEGEAKALTKASGKFEVLDPSDFTEVQKYRLRGRNGKSVLDPSDFTEVQKRFVACRLLSVVLDPSDFTEVQKIPTTD